jgi:cell wall-associated NlpC family hydrolase/LysM repeat protein
MIFKKQLFFLFFFSITFVFSQETIKHKVVSGESIYAIARKYKVTEADIYQLNPKVKGAVLQLNTIILVPNKNKNNKQIATEVVGVEEHIVQKGETLFSISKKYSISIAKLKERNPNLNDRGLQIGAKINLKPIESSQVAVTSTTNSIGNNVDFHIVQPKETKFGIAKKYGLTIAELETLNPEIVSNLPVGFQLVLKRGIANSNSNISVAQNEDLGNEELEDDSLDVLVEEVDTKEIVDVAPMSLDNTFKADFIISTASQNLGTPYRSGGTSSNGFDCSGLVCTTFEKANVKLPRSSHEMATVGIKIHKSKAQKGDLIFFRTRGSRISHVGLITEITENDIKFIHSSSSSGVIISSVNEEYYKKRFVQINRVLN